MISVDKLIEKTDKEIMKLSGAGRLNPFRWTILVAMVNFMLDIKYRLKYFEHLIRETKTFDKTPFYLYTLLIPQKDMVLYEKDFYKIIKNKEDGVVESVPIFIPFADNTKLEGRLVKGWDKDRGLEVELYLRKNYAFLNKLKKLHKIFEKNKIEWKPVPVEYLSCIYDVVPTDTRVDTDSIEFDLADLEKYAYRGYIPVWNIFFENRYFYSRVRPLKNRLIYEQVLEEDRKKILVNPEHGNIYISFRDNMGNLRIYSGEKGQDMNEIVIFNENIDMNLYAENIFPILTNKERYLSPKQKRSYDDSRILDKGQLSKYLKNFEILKSLDLVEMKKVNEFSSGGIINSDRLGKSEFCMKSLKIKMEVYFKIQDKNFCESRIKFALALMETYFPNYELKGFVAERNLYA